VIPVSKYRKRRQDKHKRRCDRLSAMRAAKVRKRQERIDAGWTPEPKMERFFPLSFAVRDDLTGEESGWIKLRSVRNASKKLAMVMKYYQAGIRTTYPPPVDSPSSSVENLQVDF
jgi:hypothetical protein